MYPSDDNNLENNHEIPYYDYLFLIPILILAFYIAFIPSQDYPYPVHIDEWNLLSHIRALQAEGSIFYADPYHGGTVDLFGMLETGYKVFWGVFQSISGISWETIYRYFPSVVFMVTVLSVYVMGHRRGFGIEAALCTCLITTTVGILGPGFLVPVAMGMIYVPLTFFLAFNYRHFWSYAVIFLFMCFLLAMHPPSAASLALIVGPFALVSLFRDFKHGLFLLLALGLPYLAPLVLIFDDLVARIQGLFVYQELPWWIDYPRIIASYGYIPIVLCIVGVFMLVLRGNRKGVGLVLGLLCMVLMMATYYTLHRGESIMYMRGLMFMMLIMSIVAGAGLMWVKNIRIPGSLGESSGLSFITQNIGKGLAIILVVVMLFVAIPDRQKEPYYHMIDDYDYEAFVWIRDNLDEEYDRAILDPWKGTPFTAITLKQVYALIHSYPSDSSREAQAFLDSGCGSTDFLREKGITIVYTRSACDNPDLTEVRESIYILEQPEG